ncbi:MAG: UTP--glucose-1-phosphate uridylyltransferase [Oscillospiraceae bacterium]|jgi:UDP-N-acetylglucosamine/UDP-N-acetylgalactosamine diphosphorylase|nr:UTP--glucose-1-phosphate uridylyltransferase [Oscillospiraceae bacterium]
MLSYEELQTLLKKEGQEHLLRFYDELSAEEQASLARQIERVDFSLIDYFKQKNFNKGEHKEEDKKELAPMKIMSLAEIEAQKESLYAEGVKLLKAQKVGAILLAGGQGSRLGVSGPKGKVDIGVTKTVYIFEMLIRNLMDVVNGAGAWVPLFVMTSEKNDAETREFFAEQDFFGYNKDFVHFYMQDMMPAVDFEGKILLEGKGQIAFSPNGNGGWFSSLVKSGLIDAVNAYGIEWLNVFAVDNVLQRIADPCFVGASSLSGTNCGAKVVRKNHPDEKVGVLCLENGQPNIVEYYELTDTLRNAKDENGDYLYAGGVILNYLFRLSKLHEINNLQMPYHIAEKKIPYVDGEGKLVTPAENNGYKFETLVLSMIRLCGDCLPYEIVREKEFAPIKNRAGVDSVESARELLRLNGVEL